MHLGACNPTLGLSVLSTVWCRRHGIPVAAVTAALSLPGFVVKQIINVCQLKASMQALAAYDRRKDSELNRKIE